jgi:hypothetical protein
MSMARLWREIAEAGGRARAYRSGLLMVYRRVRHTGILKQAKALLDELSSRARHDRLEWLEKLGMADTAKYHTIGDRHERRLR